jgi:DNA invertase Pin-like site-specific DNA recombinase
VLKKAIGYVRVSTTEQVEGFGLSVQEEAVRGFCRQHGLRLVGIERDEGISGGNGLDSRQGLARALAALESSDADVLVVKRLDRLARDLLVQETVLERLTLHGKEVRSVDEADITSDDPTRVLVRQVLGAIAQYEKGVIRGRMLAGKAAKSAVGGYTGGAPPFGTRAENRELATHPDERVTIERANALCEEGLSLREIAQVLEAEGRPTKRGKRWHPATVARMLRSDACAVG